MRHLARMLAAASLCAAAAVIFSCGAWADFTLEEVDNAAWNTSQPVEQTIDFEVASPDFRMISLPECGRVDLSYFNTATFLGDSLTQGLALYSTGLPNAAIRGYKGAGPNSVVNRAACTRQDGTTEVALDALAASQPDKVYILLGTNSLVMQGNDESFLNYYEAMIDSIRGVLDPRVIIYIQSIPGVAADVKDGATTAGLDNDRIRRINCELAALAVRKNCQFVDLQEALTNRDGTQRADLGASDGIHYLSQGYQAWVDYLCTHTAYNNLSPYLQKNPMF